VSSGAAEEMKAQTKEMAVRRSKRLDPEKAIPLEEDFGEF
jgi:hypothetical protein